MSMLSLDRGAFYRVKRGQTPREIEQAFGVPANSAFAGGIICLGDFIVHKVGPHESYESVAALYQIDAETLRKLNSDRLIYPSQKLFVPRR